MKIVLLFILSLKSYCFDSKLYNKIIDSYVKSDKFSGSVLITKNDQVIFKKAYGLASIEHNIKNNVDTSFVLASLGKQFTAAAILKLHDNKVLSIEEKISDYINDAPKSWEKIKIKHLLNHTSGLVHIPFNEKEFYKFNLPSTNQDWINEAKDKKLTHNEIGEKFSYSNLGYIILGHIIKKVTKMSFDNYMKENFYDKLEMNNTGEYTLRKVIKNHASPYIVEEGELQRGCCFRYTAVGAGSTYSSISDFNKWFQAIYNGNILSEKSKSLLFSKSIPYGKDSFYGYGWISDVWENKKRIYHSGGGYGYISLFTYLPEFGISVILFSNMDDQDSFDKPWFMRPMRDELVKATL